MSKPTKQLTPRTPRHQGRGTKLTPETTTKIINALIGGNFINTACAYAGISTTTYFRWIQEADTGISEIDTILSEDERNIRREFRDSCARARAQAEVRNVALIQTAATDPKNWAAAGWWLERSFPDKWGKQSKVIQEISGPGGAPIQITDPRELLLRLMAGEVIELGEISAQTEGQDDG